MNGLAYFAQVSLTSPPPSLSPPVSTNDGPSLLIPPNRATCQP
ncbi:hypothetical protein SAMN02745166_02252 [Prosthecobacter debontii]|uniref:Uncharacterized protein n=1 Tax=Prosthecobacter debontii TaxID=48467 RepID=A0A1T4XZS5_9BACT|nr:hypothetical protein SAMN02745166_02252 [Prosthecobacter debontii]